MSLVNSERQEVGEDRIGGIKRFWSFQTALFLGLWFWLLIAGEKRLFRDPGIFWHLRVGEQILTTGRFPHTDTFSFTASGKPWIARQWLGECAMALVHRMSGFDGLLLGTVTLLAGFYTWLAHRFLRAGVPGWLAILLAVLAMKTSYYHLHPRPALLTNVFLGWTFARLCDFESGRIPFRSLFWLVPVSLVWSNTHDGVVGGLGTMGLVIAGWGLCKLLGWNGPVVNYRQLILLGMLIIFCGLTALVNPYGVEVPRTWFTLLRSPVLPQIITEHYPLLRSPVGWAVLPFGLLYLAALVGVLPRRPRVTWLIPLVWLYLAWTRIRHGPLFVTTALIALAEMLPHVCWAEWFSHWRSDLFRFQNSVSVAGQRNWSWRPTIFPFALVVTAIALQIAAVPLPVLGRGWAKLDARIWPMDLLPELREFERVHPPGTPIFNPMNFGGFLIYYTPGLRVFIDDRCELYGDEQLLAYDRAETTDPEMIEYWARHYGFDAALAITNSRLDWYLRQSPDWRMVRQTGTAVFFERFPQRGELKSRFPINAE